MSCSCKKIEGSSSGRTPDSGSGSGGSTPPPSANIEWRNRIVVNSAGSQSANGGSIPPCATNFIKFCCLQYSTLKVKYSYQQSKLSENNQNKFNC